MIDPQELARMYSITYDIIKRQTAGMTHEESLMQLPFGGNCMNWVLGHIVASRTRIEAQLGLPTILSVEGVQRYRRGSDPVTDSEDAYPLNKLLEDFDRSQEKLITALRELSVDDMAQAKGDTTLGEWLVFLQFHEAYHSGQLEIFRQMAGKDAVIV